MRVEENWWIMAKSNFSLSVSIEANSKSFEREILKQAVVQINKNIEPRLKGLEKRVGDGFVERLKTTAEYESIVSDTGQLRLEFGIENPSYVMERILSKLKLCFSVEYKKARVVGDSIQGTFSVKFNKQDFTFLYEEASFRAIFSRLFKRKVPSSFKTQKGQKIDWLRWLLEKGSTPIIFDYDVAFGDFETSRTGGAIMMKNLGSWGVPAKYAGTRNSNWLTRTLKQYELDVQESLNLIIQDGLKNVS